MGKTNQDIFLALCDWMEKQLTSWESQESIERTQIAINNLLDFEICKRKVESYPSINLKHGRT